MRKIRATMDGQIKESEFQKFQVEGKTTSVQDDLAAQILSRGDVEESFRLALEGGINRFSALALSMRAMLKLRKSQFDEAEAIIDRLLRIQPDSRAWKMAGDCAFLRTDFEKSEFYYKKGLALSPDSPEIEHDLGVAIVSQGRTDECLEHFKRAITLSPQKADFHHHLAIMLVLSGREKEGWELMKSRLAVPGVTGTFLHPEKYWNGEDLTGKTIVIRTEQGWGDGILFASYLPWIIERAKKVYIFCQRAFMTWYKHYYPQLVIWPNDAPPPLDFDYHVNIMCFPRLIQGGYKTPRKRDSQGNGIGFCWFGSPTHKADHLRTVPVERFEPIAKVLGGKIYCLGYGRFDKKPEFTDYLIDGCHDWYDTSMIVKDFDLIISVDTAMAHLGGFLGVETWLLLPYVPDFRWGMAGETTQWYESVKLYRQPKIKDWDSVFERIKQDLSVRQNRQAVSAEKTAAAAP